MRVRRFRVRPRAFRFKALWDSIDLAIVAPQLTELNALGLVCIDEIEGCLDIIMCKRRVQPHHYLLKLLKCQLSLILQVIRLEGLIQCNLLGSNDLVQLDEALLDPHLQLRRYFLVIEAFQGFSLLDLYRMIFQLVMLGKELAECYEMFLHLGR